MKILVSGNMGYVGPGVVRELRAAYPDAEIVGFDAGFFAHSLTNAGVLPEALLDRQIFGDVRKPPAGLFDGVDVVVQLAAISNDIMGTVDESVTLDVNFASAVRFARAAKACGAKAFVFASSCSVYGFAEDGPRVESSPLNPLTAYARSKVLTEKELAPLADEDFAVTCLRFATACGMSDRLRLDLVLNDFVAAALTSRRIQVLSDGSPWRPLIHVHDMARAITWASSRPASNGGAFLVVNAGSDGWNYRVRELADAVAAAIPGTEVSINKDAAPDKRSYRVSFALYRRLAPDHQPVVDLNAAIEDLKEGLTGMNFSDADFRRSQLIRLNVLKRLRETGALAGGIVWNRTQLTGEKSWATKKPAVFAAAV